MIGNIALTLFFVLLNGFFVAAEFALVKVRSSQIELRARDGNIFAGIAKGLIEHLDAYLSACQLGITLASLALGWIGEPVVAAIVADVVALAGIQLDVATLHMVSIAVAFTIITAMHIVIGEMAPKTLAIQRSEAVTLAIALPMRAFYIVFRPVILGLNWMSNTMLRLIGIAPATEHEVHSPEELRYLIAQSGEQGALEISERELIENVFDFTETTADQVMIPRSKILALDLSDHIDALLEQVMEEGYSRLPVYDGSIDRIVGIVYAKDLLTLMHHKDLILVQDILHPAYFVQEDVKIKRLLRDMQAKRVHMAIVLDEFGGTAGLITMENILEELVGTIQDEYDEEAPLASQTTRDVWEFDAGIHIDDLNELLPKPLPSSDDYETLGGMITHVSGRIPNVGDGILLDDYTAMILAGSERRVERVRLTWRSQS
ncbi:MAG: hemolysin family protein [Candidatus Kapaibacteriota bacterium]